MFKKNPAVDMDRESDIFAFVLSRLSVEPCCMELNECIVVSGVFLSLLPPIRAMLGLFGIIHGLGLRPSSVVMPLRKYLLSGFLITVSVRVNWAQDAIITLTGSIHA